MEPKQPDDDGHPKLDPTVLARFARLVLLLSLIDYEAEGRAALNGSAEIIAHATAIQGGTHR